MNFFPQKHFRLLRITLIISICIFASCKKQDRELNVLNWAEYIPDEVLQQFKEETGIQIRYSIFSSNEELFARIKASPETYDVIFPSDYMVSIMSENNMLAKIHKPDIPNIKHIHDDYLILSFDRENLYSLPFMRLQASIMSNTNKVKENIVSYSDLWKPQYKNKIVLLDDQRIIIGMTLLSLGFPANDRNPEHIDKAKHRLLLLNENIRAYSSDNPRGLLLSNEADLAFVWHGEAVLANRIENVYRFHYTEEGPILQMDNFAIPAGSLRSREAHEFINFILRPDIAKKIADTFPYAIANKEASLKYINDKITYPDKEILNKGHYLENVYEAAPLYDRVWSEIKR